jgi:cyclomaltodextrinase
VGAVGPNWISKGASGWRLDVAGEVDAGQISDPSNGFWQGFHAAIRKVNSEAALLGENWGDARDWLISGEWDSVMNYRFRSAALSWMFDSCLGLGCENGQIFRDQNDNENNLSGAIHTLSESDFSLRLKAIAEAYPFDNWLAAMNLLGSHDTSRILFLLKKSSGDSAEIALRKLKFLALFQFTYPGAPAIYYGDEVGLAPDDIWDGQIWQGDPANRAPYPWRDQGGTPDEDLARHFARLARIHNSQPALVKGHYQTWLVDDQKRIFAFERSLAGAKTVRVVLNRSLGEQNLSIPVAPTLEGMEFVDLLSGKTFVAHNQKLDLGAIAGLWGMILLPAKTDALIGK